VLDTQVFYSHCRKLLTEDGVMTVNLFGRNSSFESSIGKIRKAFGDACVWSFRPTREGNTVVIATRLPQLPDRETLAQRAQNIETLTRLPARKWLRILQAPQ
jgi:spermidine synthase